MSLERTRIDAISAMAFLPEIIQLGNWRAGRYSRQS